MTAKKKNIVLIAATAVAVVLTIIIIFVLKSISNSKNKTENEASQQEIVEQSVGEESLVEESPVDNSNGQELTDSNSESKVETQEQLLADGGATLNNNAGGSSTNTTNNGNSSNQNSASNGSNNSNSNVGSNTNNSQSQTQSQPSQPSPQPEQTIPPANPTGVSFGDFKGRLESMGWQFNVTDTYLYQDSLTNQRMGIVRVTNDAAYFGLEVNSDEFDAVILTCFKQLLPNEGIKFFNMVYGAFENQTLYLDGRKVTIKQYDAMVGVNIESY